MSCQYGWKIFSGIFFLSTLNNLWNTNIAKVIIYYLKKDIFSVEKFGRAE